MASNWQASIWWRGSRKRFPVILHPHTHPSNYCRVFSCPRELLPETRMLRLDWFRAHDCSEVNQSINDKISFLSVCSMSFKTALTRKKTTLNCTSFCTVEEPNCSTERNLTPHMSSTAETKSANEFSYSNGSSECHCGEKRSYEVRCDVVW